MQDNDNDFVEDLPVRPPKRPDGTAQEDMPHPFLARIIDLVYGEETPTQEHLDTVKAVLTTFACLTWPGDVWKHMQGDMTVQSKIIDAVNYICKDILKGSPIPPPKLRQGVILTAPRS